MKQITTPSTPSNRSNEKWLLLLVVVLGLSGLLLTFNSTPKEKDLDIEGIRLQSRMNTPSASVEVQEDYVLRY